MIKRIINITKHLFIGKCEIIRPIIDTNIYNTKYDSYSGNSLQDSNVLIIGNNEKLNKNALDSFSNEGCYTATLNIGLKVLDYERIEQSRETILGHFDHIINIVEPDGNSSLFINDIYNNDDIIHVVYQWMQVETDYLINNLRNLKSSTLHIIFIKKDIEYMDVISISMAKMIRGLASRLLVHNIITNGIIADESVPLKSIMHSLMFISGKYGQVISGEILNLKNR